MTNGMGLLLDILKIVAYIGGAFLVAFRVAKYFITRDNDLKGDTIQMKADIEKLGTKIDTLNATLKDYNLMQSQVDDHDTEIQELRNNYKEIMKMLTQIQLDMKDKADR